MDRKTDLDRKLLALLQPHWRLLSLAIFCAVGIAGVQLSLIAVMGDALEVLTGKSLRLLITLCLALPAIYAARWLFAVGQAVGFGEVGQRIGQQLRMRIYTHLQTMSLAYFDNQRTGNLLSMFNNDVPVVQGGIMSIKDLIASPIVAIGAFIVIFVLSWRLTLITLVIMPLMGWAINTISSKLREISKQTQNALGQVTTTAEETLAGARLVRAFGAEQREVARFGGEIQAAKDITMTGVRRMALLSPTTDLLGAVGMAVALYVGGTMVIHGQMSAKHLVEFIGGVDRVRVGVGGFGGIGANWRQTLGAAERIFGKVLDVPAAVSDAPGARPLQLTRGEVEFDDVSFAYLEGRPVLRGVSFAMRAGQVTAVVGPSGAGKSTLADLIPRFYDVTGGGVVVDGQDTRGVTVASLREQIGIVPQETIIFGGSVRDNIAYGRPDATLEQVEEAARAANAHEFVSQMPMRYDTIVGERGVMLSGGQRQRIAIARALLKDPRILILDEATSSLDENSQILVQGALDKLMKGRTTLVIAHRLSTIKNADRIVVLEAGRIVESGSHFDLLRRGGAYAKLYETQFRSSEEDAGVDDGLGVVAA